jgi:tetratricopeptide (TPR) repeat protein
MDIKPKITHLLEWTIEQELSFIAELSEAEKSATGTYEHWAIKDTLAHIAAWKIHITENLALAYNNQTPVNIEDYEAVNKEIFEAHHRLPWTVIEHGIQAANANLMARLQRISEEDLCDPQRFAWQEGQPLWRGIAGNSFFHPLTHLATLFIERGKPERARRMLKEAARLAEETDRSPEWRGAAIYNLACCYAQTGFTELAIENLKTAFEIQPDLIEWSKKDPDLDSIRQQPAYQALYGIK